MACHLFSAKPLSEPTLDLSIGPIGRNFNFNQNEKKLFHKNVFENIVCEMATILSRGDVLIFYDKYVNGTRAK